MLPCPSVLDCSRSGCIASLSTSPWKGVLWVPLEQSKSKMFSRSNEPSDVVRLVCAEDRAGAEFSWHFWTHPTSKSAGCPNLQPDLGTCTCNCTCTTHFQQSYDKHFALPTMPPPPNPSTHVSWIAVQSTSSHPTLRVTPLYLNA